MKFSASIQLLLVGALSSHQALTVTAKDHHGLNVAHLDSDGITEDQDFVILENPVPISLYQDYKRGQAVLSPSLVNSIHNAVGSNQLPLRPTAEGVVVQTTFLGESSPRHSDHYQSNSKGVRPAVGSDRVAFITLNTNSDAYFELGENEGGWSTPIVAGNVVSFEGGIPHRTIVNSGVVSLLGPFDINHFRSVGPCKGGCVIGGFGDPHFQKWDGSRYDYHGECDLVMIRAPAFANDLGFHLHVRTTIVDTWSYIETVALRIGEDVLEVSAKGVYSVNGIPNAELSSNNKILSGFEVTYFPPGSLEHEARWYRFEVNLKEAGRVVLKSFANKPFMAVFMEDIDKKSGGKYYGDSMGLMGTFGASIMLARDGLTVHEDPNEFSQEWQVHPEEDPLIFNTLRAPQYPDQKCIPPPTASATSLKKARRDRRHRRRLSESISEHEAEMACAEWSANEKEGCVFDVMATGDIELAEAGGY